MTTPAGGLLVIEGLHATALEELLSLVSGLSASAMRRSDRVIIRVSVALGGLLLDPGYDEDRMRVASRVDLPVYASFFDPSLKKICALNLSSMEVEQQGSSSILTELLATDVQNSLERVGDLPIHAVQEHFIYVAPSGRYCEEFFRLGNVLVCKENVDAFAFWIQPEIHGCEGVLLDTWSIASVFYRACDLLGVKRILEVLEAHPYADQSRSLNIVNRLHRAVRARETILCLISVASTGKLVEIIGKQLSDVGRDKDLVVYRALCAMKKSPEASYSLFELEHRAVCSDPKTFSDRKPIPIDSVLYYPRSSPETPVKLTQLRWTDTKGGPTPTELIDEYAAADALRVHVTHDRFHIPMFIDFEKVFATPGFDARLQVALDGIDSSDERFGRPDVVLYVRGPASPMFARRAQEALGSVEAEEFGEVDPTKVAGKHILVVADVVASGRTVALRNKLFRDRHCQPKSITFLVGLYRPAGTTALELLRNQIAREHVWKARVRYVDHLLLPEGECPWCQEVQALSTHLDRFDIDSTPEWLSKRLLRLRSPMGLADEPFLGPKCSPAGSGSDVFLEGWSEMAVLFRFACGLQALRTDPDTSKKLAPGYFFSNCLEAETLEKFSEQLFRSALLRLVTPAEWGSAHQQRLAAVLQGALAVDKAEDLIGELYLALAKGSVYPSFAEDLEKDVRERCKEIAPWLSDVWRDSK